MNTQTMLDVATACYELTSHKPMNVKVNCWGRKCKAICDIHGNVSVWDDIAGHYTRCHPLTAGQIRYVQSHARLT